MPQAAPTRCARPDCGKIATKYSRCDEHQRKPWESPSANTQALSGSQRRAIRNRQIRREPQCRNCGSKTSLEADHILSVERGGALTDPANLQTLCKPCHEAKSKIDRLVKNESAPF